LIKNIIDYKGEINWDTTKLDGTPRKLLDVSKVESLSWRHKIGLETGIKMTYEWYLKNKV